MAASSRALLRRLLLRRLGFFAGCFFAGCFFATAGFFAGCFFAGCFFTGCFFTGCFAARFVARGRATVPGQLAVDRTVAERPRHLPAPGATGEHRQHCGFDTVRAQGRGEGADPRRAADHTAKMAASTSLDDHCGLRSRW